MLARLLYRLTENLPARAIRIDDRPYMERYYVGRCLGVTVYLHRFLAGDGDRQVHDHPWRWALGIPLVGGYVEERLEAFCPTLGWISRVHRVRRFRLNLIGARTFHQIVHVEPGTWTLFAHGARFKGWGFLSRRHKEAAPVVTLRGVPLEFDPVVDGAVYHQPFDFDRSRDWECRAVTGRELRAAEGTDL